MAAGAGRQHPAMIWIGAPIGAQFYVHPDHLAAGMSLRAIAGTTHALPSPLWRLRQEAERSLHSGKIAALQGGQRLRGHKRRRQRLNPKRAWILVGEGWQQELLALMQFAHVLFAFSQHHRD